MENGSLFHAFHRTPTRFSTLKCRRPPGDGDIDYKEFIKWFQGGGAGDGPSYAEEVEALYRAHAPDQLKDVPGLLAKYQYEEESLVKALRKKFGLETSLAKRERQLELEASQREEEAAGSTALVVAAEAASVEPSLGVALLTKLTPMQLAIDPDRPRLARLKVIAAAALIDQQAEDNRRSKLSPRVWAQEEGLLISPAGLAEAERIVAEGQGPAEAARLRREQAARDAEAERLRLLAEEAERKRLYEMEKLAWEEKQRRLEEERLLNERLAWAARRRELFDASPRTAAARRAAKNYVLIKKDGAAAYGPRGAFSEGLHEARDKAVDVTKQKRRTKVIRSMLLLPAKRAFLKWVAFVKEGAGHRGIAALRGHVAWNYDGLNTMLGGVKVLTAEAADDARQAAANRVARRAARPLNRFGRHVTEQAEKFRRSLSPGGSLRAAIMAQPDPRYAQFARSRSSDMADSPRAVRSRSSSASPAPLPGEF